MGAKKATDGLTARQRMFVELYLGECRFNATEAARAAGYKGNSITLSAVGYENLRKPQIAEAINRRIDEAAMSANEVLARLSAQARGSVDALLTTEGYFPYLDLEKAKRNGSIELIKKITFNDFGGVKSFELYDAQAALVQLGKHHKLFTEEVDVNVRTYRLVDDTDGDTTEQG